jgi:hypothetical protein
MNLILLDILSDDKKPWIALAIGVIAVSYLMLKPKMRFASKRRDPLKSPSTFGSLSQQRATERQMENLLVELSEMARQITAQLDTRAAKLEELIRQADAKIQQLRSAESSARPAQTTHDPAVTSEYLFPEASAIPSSAKSSRMKISHSFEEPDVRHAEIYRLADQGRGAKEIAAALGKPSGEIELILALRTRRAS